MSLDWLKWLRYLPLLKLAGEALKDVATLPEDWTSEADVNGWIDEAQPECVGVATEVAKIIKEGRADDDDPVIIGRLKAAIEASRPRKL